MRIIFTLLLFSFFTFKCCSQGLRFNGNSTSIESRTSYVVFADDEVCAKKRIAIAFKAAIDQTQSYGNMLRLKLEQQNLTYTLIYRQDDEGIQEFKLNEEGKDNLITIRLKKNSLHQGQWFNVNLAIDVQNQTISLNVYNKQQNAKLTSLPAKICPVIHFGKGDYIVDVPDFSIKELNINNDEHKYTFLLNESSGSEVHDAEGKIYGKVANPIWLINNAFHWKKILNTSSNTIAGANFDERRQQILMFNQDSLSIFDLLSRALKKVAYKNPLPVKVQLGNSFIYQNELYIYEVNNLPSGAVTIAAVNLDTYACRAISTAALPMQLHHHTGFLDVAKHRYIVIGGFGNRRYNSNVLSFDLKTNVWDTLTTHGDKIEPRYFSSSYYNEKQNEVYIYGGMGNESGDYTIGRRYFYDFHTLDLNTLQVKKNWENKWKERNMVPVRKMIAGSDAYCYMLSYPEYLPHSNLNLYRLSVKDGAMVKMGDKIPIQSEKIKTNANLFLSDQLNELYCIVQEFDKEEIHSSFAVYSLSFPPISETELHLYSASSNNKSVFYSIAAFVAIGSCLSFLWYKKRTAEKENKKEKPAAIQLVHHSEAEKVSNEDLPNAIFTFGMFKINDRNGKDISHLFSTKIKQAFLLILLNSQKHGISSQELSDALWPDKDQQQTKNIRGVSINQLRKVLTNLDGIELVYDKGVFKVLLSENCYCDYFVFSTLLEKKDFPLYEFLSVLERGKFLKHLNYPMFDDLKDKTEKRILSLLPGAIENYYNESQYEIVLRLAKACLLTDQLNEISVYYQISAMEKLGLKDDAKRQYLSFTKDYLKVMGEEYPQTYSNFLKQKPVSY